MKKLGLVTIFLILFANCFSQEVKLEKIISITLNPTNLGIGIFYVSNPILELNRDYALNGTMEYNTYSETNTKIIKTGIGLSTIYRNLIFNFTGCYNHIKTDYKEKSFNIISLEIGVMTKYNQVYISITFDPINLEPKLGLGIIL